MSNDGVHRGLLEKVVARARGELREREGSEQNTSGSMMGRPDWWEECFVVVAQGVTNNLTISTHEYMQIYSDIIITIRYREGKPQGVKAEVTRQLSTYESGARLPDLARLTTA